MGHPVFALCIRDTFLFFSDRMNNRVVLISGLREPGGVKEPRARVPDRADLRDGAQTGRLLRDEDCRLRHGG